MKNVLLILATVMSLFLISVAVYAQTEVMMSPAAGQVSPAFLKAINAAPAQVDYFDKDSPAEKLGTGILNVATSWTDIPAEVIAVSQEENVASGATMGLAKGVVSGVARGVSGAYDTATCAFAPYDKPAMEPAYKVAQPQNEGLKVKLLQW